MKLVSHLSRTHHFGISGRFTDWSQDWVMVVMTMFRVLSYIRMLHMELFQMPWLMEFHWMLTLVVSL
jgi:hypothetical protein